MFSEKVITSIQEDYCWQAAVIKCDGKMTESGKNIGEKKKC